MSIGVGLFWTSIAALTVWRWTVVARSAHPSATQKAVAVLFTTSLASNSVGIPAVRGVIDSAAPGLSYLCSYTLLMVLYSGFVYLFASGETSRPQWVRSATVQAAVVGVACAVFAGLWLAAPDAERSTHLIDLGRQTSPLPYLGFFVLTGYLLYASAVSVTLAWAEARYTHRAARIGYQLAAIGMTLTALGAITYRAVLAVGAWNAHTPITPTQNQLPHLLSLTGIALLLVGLLALAAHPAIEPRRAFLALRPLYNLLYNTIPTIALHPPETFLREATYTNRALRKRWPHRAIACHDGLRPIGEHITATDHPDLTIHTGSRHQLDPDDHAALVLLGCTRAARGDTPVNTAAPYLLGRHSDGDREIECLIALSRAVRRQQKQQAHAARTTPDNKQASTA